MLQSLITSNTRIKILMRFFLNPKARGYLRQLATEFGESTNSIRLELNKLSQARILSSTTEGRNKVYRANLDHPLFTDIRNIVLKSTGIDKVLSNIIEKLGPITLAFIRGDYAIGKDSGLIDLVVIGDNINFAELERVRHKTEKLTNRKISILHLTNTEYRKLEHNFAREEVLVLLDQQKEKKKDRSISA